ncbi:type II CAAX prenyl endopeptidase Rce1 family protein [Salinigranum sp. GCM10025319]|uniref:CPBP family glutamic-type intramembrane protease n=1 Tax=Salinigranum sp. GCM10025319 TaxID=3252687 RepID=UPI0036069907
MLYTGIANLLIGTVLALWLVREFVAAGFSTRERLGFRSPRRTLVAVFLAGVLGLALYVVQHPPSTDPIVVLNAFAQVLPVSIAEIVVCWVLVGGSVLALLRKRGTNEPLSKAIALVVSSVLFGVYHLAHSPPFNTPEMIGLLTGVGVVTSLFYFVGQAAYGALVLHNFLALFGVTSALAEAGQLGTYQEPVVPLLVTAAVSLTVLVSMERTLILSSGDTPSGTAED